MCIFNKSYLDYLFGLGYLVIEFSLDRVFFYDLINLNLIQTKFPVK